MTTADSPGASGHTTRPSTSRDETAIHVPQGRFRRFQSALFARVRHPGAAAISAGGEIGWNPRILRGRHCVLVSHRADGTPVPTPVWIGVDGERVFVRTGVDAYKVKRIRRDPAVLLAPSTSRGRPTGAAMSGYARVLDRDEEPLAECALRARQGLLRRFYVSTMDRRLPVVYIEIGPRPSRRE